MEQIKFRTSYSNEHTRGQTPERSEETRKTAIKGGCILFVQLFNEIINTTRCQALLNFYKHINSL